MRAEAAEFSAWLGDVKAGSTIQVRTDATNVVLLNIPYMHTELLTSYLHQ